MGAQCEKSRGMWSVLEESPSDHRRDLSSSEGPECEQWFIVPMKRAVNKINLERKGRTERKMVFYKADMQ